MGSTLRQEALSCSWRHFSTSKLMKKHGTVYEVFFSKNENKGIFDMYVTKLLEE